MTSQTDSFNSIWSQYQSKLKALLHSRVPDSMEVEDLLQNIMLKVYQKRDSLKSADNLKAWLYQIAQNSIFDYYRQQGRAADMTEGVQWYEEPEFTASQNLAECVEPFIANLPTEEAELLRMFDLQDQSQKDYAREQGIAYSTLKSRVQKARANLRDLFTDCCQLSFDARGGIADFEPKNNCKNNC